MNEGINVPVVEPGQQSEGPVNPDQIPYKTGTMVKDPRDMTDAELAVWQRECADNARAYLFSIGQPLVYRRADGCRVAEYENGRVVVLSGAPQ